MLLAWVRPISLVASSFRGSQGLAEDEPCGSPSNMMAAVGRPRRGQYRHSPLPFADKNNHPEGFPTRINQREEQRRPRLGAPLAFTAANISSAWFGGTTWRRRFGSQPVLNRSTALRSRWPTGDVCRRDSRPHSELSSELAHRVLEALELGERAGKVRDGVDRTPGLVELDGLGVRPNQPAATRCSPPSDRAWLFA
jgi:hypothetical protein